MPAPIPKDKNVTAIGINLHGNCILLIHEPLNKDQQNKSVVKKVNTNPIRIYCNAIFFLRYF